MVALGMAGEVWVVVEEAPEYWVSDRGRVRSTIGNGTVLSPATDRNYTGYCHVQLRIGGRRQTRRVHRLVAAAFLGDGDGRQVNHKNGVKTDNRLSNLKWVTPSENIQHARDVLGVQFGDVGEAKPLAKLTDKKVLEIRRRAAAGEKYKPLADDFGVDRSTISTVARGLIWSHVGGPRAEQRRMNNP